jgi:subtilisin family serine protease
MKTIRFFAGAGLLLSALISGARAGDDGLIIRVTPTQVNTVAKQHGLKIVKQLTAEGVYLANSATGVASSTLLQGLSSDPLVQHVEANQKVALPPHSSAGPNGKVKTPKLNYGAPMLSIPLAWAPYVNQWAVSTIGLPQAQQLSRGAGVRVAVIDTAIDFTHPVLAGSIDAVNAYDAILDLPGLVNVSQETSPFVDQETSPFVDSAGNVVLNQETSPFVDQETSPFVDQETSPFVDQMPIAWGHGTMTAGLVHLVAPNASIIPIRAFDDNGAGTVADVIESINWAVGKHVQVISMSFSAAGTSPELDSAIAAAVKANVICIASVSNAHTAAPVYPASNAGVLGIGATDQQDKAATFTDFGPDVALGAPGVQITSTYPRNHYATGDGTSFATPLTAGAAAAMLSSGATSATVATYLKSGADGVKGNVQLGAGRLDVCTSVSLAFGKSSNACN